MLTLSRISRRRVTTIDRPHRRASRIAAASAMLILTAACSGPLQAGPASQAPAVIGPPVPASSTVGLATTRTDIGTVVTHNGFTVYRFDADPTNPSRSTCTGECAEKWPPVLGDGVPRLSGVNSRLVGTIGRPDGTQQLTLNGWPLYRFADDKGFGETKGEASGGVWWALGADGRPVAPAAERAAAAPAGAAPAAPTASRTAAPAPSAAVPAGR